METLSVNKAEALSEYNAADDSVKSVLKKLFGNQLITKITDRIKTFEDACEYLGVPTTLPYPSPANPDEVSMNAYRKLTLIIRALCEGWTPDWDDSDQYKYFPWLEWTGSGFSFSNYNFATSYARVGSRLCLPSSELALYAGKQFESIYNEFFIL